MPPLQNLKFICLRYPTRFFLKLSDPDPTCIFSTQHNTNCFSFNVWDKTKVDSSLLRCRFADYHKCVYLPALAPLFKEHQFGIISIRKGLQGTQTSIIKNQNLCGLVWNVCFVTFPILCFNICRLNTAGYPFITSEQWTSPFCGS